MNDTSSPRMPLLLILIASLSSLGFAYISQYGFGLKPCHLCYYQRIPYGLIILLTLGSLLFPLSPKIRHLVILLCALLFFTDTAIAFYHMGVEYHWFAGPDACTGDEKVPTTVQAMLDQIKSTPRVRCDIPAFIFLGLSMAGWNMIWSFLLGIVTLILSKKHF